MRALAFSVSVALAFTVVALIGLFGQKEPPQRHPAACICPQHRGMGKGRRRAA